VKKRLKGTVVGGGVATICAGTSAMHASWWGRLPTGKTGSQLVNL